jgi:hypothetical protein
MRDAALVQTVFEHIHHRLLGYGYGLSGWFILSSLLACSRTALTQRCRLLPQLPGMRTQYLTVFL